MKTSSGSRRVAAFEAAMSEAGRHIAAGNLHSAFAAFEREHVLGQIEFVAHLRVHWHMLRVGWRLRNRREVTGQLIYRCRMSLLRRYTLLPARLRRPRPRCRPRWSSRCRGG